MLGEVTVVDNLSILFLNVEREGHSFCLLPSSSLPMPLTMKSAA